MDKRVLLPTDFSKNALNAIRYALDLYKDQNCDFYFLNAFQVRVYSTDNMMVPEPGNRAFEEAKKSSEEDMLKLMGILELYNDNPKHRHHTISTYNSLLEAVRNTIAKRDIDLVVMGTKGVTGSDDVIFGTNTVNIMEKITACPVLGIPDDFRFSPPKEIVFPTDYKTNFKRRELSYLLEIAKMHNSAIQIVHIAKKSKLNSAQESNKQLLETILGGHDYMNHVLTKTKVYKGINTFIKDRGSDMIAFVNKKHLFFGSILSNPLVKEIGYDSHIPVLVLNDNS